MVPEELYRLDSETIVCHMEDLTGLGKVADSQIVKRIYEDGLSKATREAGETLADVTKAFRLFLAPIQLLAVAQDRLADFCNRVRSAVPEDRQIEAAPSIAAPVLLELRYMEDDNPITELYLNLLKRAIDRDKSEDAHPAFVRIIGQLCPDEAMILHHLSSTEIHMVEYRQNKAGFSFDSIGWGDYPVQELQTSRRLVMLLEHLEYLNLVRYSVGRSNRTEEYPRKEGCLALESVAVLTEFGRLFVDTCEP